MTVVSFTTACIVKRNAWKSKDFCMHIAPLKRWVRRQRQKMLTVALILSASYLFFPMWEYKLPPYGAFVFWLLIGCFSCLSFHSGNYSRRKHIHVTTPLNHLLTFFFSPRCLSCRKEAISTQFMFALEHGEFTITLITYWIYVLLSHSFVIQCSYPNPPSSPEDDILKL